MHLSSRIIIDTYHLFIVYNFKHNLIQLVLFLSHELAIAIFSNKIVTVYN